MSIKFQYILVIFLLYYATLALSNDINTTWNGSYTKTYSQSMGRCCTEICIFDKYHLFAYEKKIILSVIPYEYCHLHKIATSQAGKPTRYYLIKKLPNQLDDDFKKNWKQYTDGTSYQSVVNITSL